MFITLIVEHGACWTTHVSHSHWKLQQTPDAMGCMQRRGLAVPCTGFLEAGRC